MKNNKSKFLITTIHKNKFEKIKVVLDAFALPLVSTIQIICYFC